MTDFTLHVKIEAPELCAALALLAGNRSAAAPAMFQDPIPAPLQAQVSAPAAPPAPVAVTPAAAPISAPVPTPAAPVPAPTAAARQYNFPDIQRAATDLCDAGKRDAVLALLGQYQIKALSELPADQYGAFATALRGLGAKI